MIIEPIVRETRKKPQMKFLIYLTPYTLHETGNETLKDSFKRHMNVWGINMRQPYNMEGKHGQMWQIPCKVESNLAIM